MADKKSNPTPVSDTKPAPDANVADVSLETATVPEAAKTTTSFEADSFLAGRASDSAPAASPISMKSKAKAEPATPQVVKRGGVGFMTALLMSCLATAGGAYMALFAQSRPDLLQQAGLVGLMPKAAPVPSTGSSPANYEPLAQRVTAIEAELLVLKNKLEGQGSTALPTPSTPSTTTPPVAGTPRNAAAVPAPTTNPNTATLPSAALADVGTMKSELAGIGGRVTAIETRLAALDPTGAGGAIVAGLQADIASLKAIIAGLQQQVSSAPSPAVTFAVVNLAEAANRSGPFLTEFETLRSAMPGVPEVASLEGYARTGVPTRVLLQERFAALGPAIVAAADAGQKEGGLVVWIRSLFSDMIKVRPAPTANGKSGDDVLARAKTKLDQGDLGACVDELSALQSPPLVVTEWVANARKRMDLESKVSAVRGAVGRVAAPTPPNPLAAPASISPPPGAPVPTAPVPNAPVSSAAPSNPLIAPSTPAPAPAQKTEGKTQ